jgi:hypothetical protein
MNLYSRALRHVDMKRVKELYEEKLEREKVAKLLEDIRREELLNLNIPEFSNWRFDLYEQGMSPTGNPFIDKKSKAAAKKPKV